MKKGSLFTCPKPLFQSDAKWEAIDIRMGFYSHVDKTHFQDKGFALTLVLKLRVFGTPKWPIRVPFATGLG